MVYDKIEIMELLQRQRDVIIGTILGDGYLDILSGGKLVRLGIIHSLRQQHYVRWKFQQLRQLVRMPPRREVIEDRRYDKLYVRFRFYTLNHPVFAEYRRTFYKGNQKIVPRFIDELLRSPLSLAVWSKRL